MAEPMGFFTDTTVCIGCKACEVACKNWNQLPARAGGQPQMSGQSYDNTLRLSGDTWRHVKFVERTAADPAANPRRIGHGCAAAVSRGFKTGRCGRR